MYGFPHTIVVVRADCLTDENGAPLPQRDWANASQTTVTGVNVQPLTSVKVARDDVYRDSLQWRMFTPPGRDIDLVSTDRVHWEGRCMQVLAPPMRWPGFAGGVHHVEAVLGEVPMESGEGGPTEAGQLGVSTRSAATRGAGWTP